MMGDGGIAGWRAVDVLFIVGMDGAAQRADDHQHQPVSSDSLSCQYIRAASNNSFHCRFIC